MSRPDHVIEDRASASYIAEYGAPKLELENVHQFKNDTKNNLNNKIKIFHKTKIFNTCYIHKYLLAFNWTYPKKLKDKINCFAAKNLNEINYFII